MVVAACTFAVLHVVSLWLVALLNSAGESGACWLSLGVAGCVQFLC